MACCFSYLWLHVLQMIDASSLHPSSLRQQLQYDLLVRHVNSLPPLPYWRRETISTSFSPSHSLSIQPSRIVPSISGVMNNSDTIKFSSLSQPPSLASYPGFILTLSEYSDLPFHLRTGVDMTLISTFVRDDKDRSVDSTQYILVGDPRSIGANINCRRPLNSKANVHLHFALTGPSATVRPRLDCSTSPPTVIQKGYLYDSSVRVRPIRTIPPNTELLADYGYGFWIPQDSDTYCHRYTPIPHSSLLRGACRFVPSHLPICACWWLFVCRCLKHQASNDNDILICSKCNSFAIHQLCIDPPLLNLPPAEVPWFCSGCSFDNKDSLVTLRRSTSLARR